MSRPSREPPGPPLKSSLPRWKKALFSLLTVAAFFALAELVLTVLGVKPVLATRDPFVGFAALPLFVETAGDDGQTWMVTATNKLAYFNRQRFPKQKPPNIYRIFCLGGSTTYGHPYDDTTSFAAWLRELLPMAAPGTRFEVINAGGISYASYRVAALVEELTAYQPDLFIVYSGHNEFLEERTYRDMQAASPGRLRLTAALARTRTYAVLDSLLNRPTREPTERLESEVDAVLDHTVGPSSYQRDDPLRQRVFAHFEFNLHRMATLARASGAEILFVTPASNLKDCSPFKSQHGEGLSPLERQRCADHLARARQCEQQGDPAGASAEYQTAAKIDPRYAEVHFGLGRCLLALDRPVEAAAAFAGALDEDICPVRAPSEIGDIVRRAGRDAGVPVVDYVALLQNESLRTLGHTVPGNEFFLDHVHPTVEATGWLAAAIARQMAESQLITPQAAWTQQQIAEAGQRIESRIDPAAQAVAWRTLAKVLNWAGKHEQAGPLAVKALKTLPDDPESLVLAAAYLKSKGDADQAIEHYRRALRHAPRYVEAHRLLGAALVESARFEESLEHFEQLTRLTPDDAHAWHMRGAVLAELGRHREAVAHFETAIERFPNEPHVHYNLGRSLKRLGNKQHAAASFRRALEQNPRDTEAQRELDELTSP